MKSRYNPKEANGKAKIAQEMLSSINKFKSAVLRSEYIKQLAQELDVREEALLEESGSAKCAAQYERAGQPVERKALNVNPAEKLLISLMLQESELVHYIRQRLAPSDFRMKKFPDSVFMF